MNEFSKKFKSLPNRNIIKIIEESEKYHSSAVLAAKAELSKRKIANEEINKIRNELENEMRDTVNRQEKISRVESKVKNMGIEILETVNPIQSEPQSTYRKINLIVIVFGILAFYQFVKEFKFLYFMFTDSFAKWDLSMIIYFIPIIFLPIAIFLFWKRNILGWLFLCYFFIYNVVNYLAVLCWELRSKYVNSNDNSLEGTGIELIEIESLFPSPNPIYLIMLFLIYLGSFWSICNDGIREEFRIDKRKVYLTIGISVFLTLISIGIMI